VKAEAATAPALDFRRAKAEHYLERAQELVGMGRILAARKPLELLFSLDPSNSMGRLLAREVERTFGSLIRPGEDTSAGEGTNGRSRRTELVMIVDQDERLLGKLAGSLRRFGFRVVSAGGYQEAVDMLGSVTPQVILSEVNFENGSVGFDLYLMVRTTARLQSVPFLFLATRVDRETLIAGKRLGVNDFITKPLDPEVVHASIVSVLSRARMEAHGALPSV
jgi:PleD family two-component response regulator